MHKLHEIGWVCKAHLRLDMARRRQHTLRAPAYAHCVTLARIPNDFTCQIHVRLCNVASYHSDSRPTAPALLQHKATVVQLHPPRRVGTSASVETVSCDLTKLTWDV